MVSWSKLVDGLKQMQYLCKYKFNLKTPSSMVSLVQSQDATISWHRICQSQTNDDWRKNFLTSGASISHARGTPEWVYWHWHGTATIRRQADSPSSHIKFYLIFHHDHSIVISLPRRSTVLIVVRADSDGIDICAQNTASERYGID